MKISLLTPDISSNSFGRAYVLAKVLQRRYEVEIIGPAFSQNTWEPLSKSGLNCKLIQVDRRSRHIFRLGKLLKLIAGDVLYVSKPLLTSYGIGLLKKLSTRRPLVLDIDDWQWGFVKASMQRFSTKQKARYLIASTVRPHVVSAYWNGLIFERMARFANDVTVSNRFLKNKFGGHVFYHGRDTNSLRPDSYNRIELRKKYQLDDREKALVFLGTVHPYKGIEDLVRAVAGLDMPNLKLILAGVTVGPHSRNAVELAHSLLGSRVRVLGLQPFERIPEFMAVADVVVVPQRKTPATVGQMPAKLFDAMAMGKPIVSTAVSDIPEVLDGCGWVAEPGDPESLRAAIDHALSNPQQAEEYGRQAREKCMALYSWDSMEKKLAAVFERYE
jgi:glycosyltransferase involved in cell wall biosynthesis